MTELSDYRRMVEAPMIESYDATINALNNQVASLTARNTALEAALLLARRAILKETVADEQLALNDIDGVLGASMEALTARVEQAERERDLWKGRAEQAMAIMRAHGIGPEQSPDREGA